jgi:dolichyl-diphosphooligosaccharide--protein glycosyltransferase
MRLVDGEGRLALRILTPTALFLLAVAIRALPWRSVLGGDRVHPCGNDAFYHLRRIVFSVRHFPEALVFDRYINFPEGARPIWTPAFDWTVALAVRPFLPDGSVDGVERLAVWVPPVLGGATVVALYFLAKKHFGMPTAILSGLILSLLSAHFWYSQIGFVDHHAAVALMTTLLLASAMTLLRRPARDPPAPLRAWREGAAAGIALGAALLVWPGSGLHVGLVESGLLVHLLSRRQHEQAIGFAARFAAANATALLLVLPPGATGAHSEWGRFSPVVLTGFQPWLFGVLVLFGLACAGLWRWPRLGSDRRRRAAAGAAVGCCLLAASAALFPELLVGGEDAWRWLAKRESFQAGVSESRSLVVDQGRLAGHLAAVRLSYFFFLFPLAVVAALRSLGRGRDRSSALLLLWWSLGLFAVTLVQKRFFNSFSVAMALVMGWTLCLAVQSLPRRWLATRARRGAVWTGLCALVLLLLLPVLRSYAPYVSNQVGLLRGRTLVLPGTVARRRVTVRMAHWLRYNTPATSGWMGEGVPEYGVMAPWPVGHPIEYAGRRPTVTDNFGDDIGEENFHRARRYYLAREGEGSQILEQLGVRYVVAQSRHGYLGEAPAAGSMFRSLYFRNGSESAPPWEDPRGGRVEALERHRLVYESRPLREAQSDEPPVYKIFEFVEGARIDGRAAPRARIRLTLPLRTNRGRVLVYAASAVADAQGRYALRVPYANRGAPPAVRAAPHYTLECEGESAPLWIDESAIRKGRTVRGPDLCL